MPLTLSGTTGIAGVDGSAGTPATKGSDTDTGIVYGTNTVQIATNGTTAVTVDSSQNVGIGIASPATKLDVNGDLTFRNGSGVILGTITNNVGWYQFGGSTNVNGAQIYSGAATPIRFGVGASFTEVVRIDSSGNLLVGYTAPAGSEGFGLVRAANTATYWYLKKSTQVEATFGFKSSTDTNLYIGSNSYNVGTYGVYLTNGGSSWNAVSDERNKTILETIDSAIDKVTSLRTVIGYYNNDKLKARRPFLIAQDVQAVMPEAVSIADADTGTLGLSYTDVLPLAIAAIKELSAKLDAAEARIAALEAK